MAGWAKYLPRWPTLALAAILILAGALRLVLIEQNGFGTPYYAAAVRSMAMSWHNFFFAAFDPAGFLSIDKPPVAFWLQALSVKLLGFTGLALHLPQALCGMAAVALLYHLVARRFGALAGLLAGLFLALSPINVAVDRANNTDSCLTLMLVLAAWPMILAAERASWRLLLLAAALIGVAFNVKMAASLLVLPGFIALYAFTATASWPRRILRLAAAALVLGSISLSWPLAVELTPKNARPYVDSTQSNSVVELAIGHNAFDRFVRPSWLVNAPPPPGLPPGVPAGPLRLADPSLSSQIGWLAALALFGVFLCRHNPARLLWGGWAGVCLIVFSFAGGIFLPYYLATLAPPLCALAAIGIVALRGARQIALALGVTLLCQGFIVWGNDVNLLYWPLWTAIGAVMAAALALLAIKRSGDLRAPLAVAVLALLVAPSAWSLGPILARGSNIYPSAQLPGLAPPPLIAAFSGANFDGIGNRRRLIGYLMRNRSGARFLLGASSIAEASAMIIRIGEPVLALGGYNAATPVIGQDELARRIAAGEIRFFLISDQAGTDPASPTAALYAWLRTNGREIDPATWRPPLAAPGVDDETAKRRAAYLMGLRLYDLRKK